MINIFSDSNLKKYCLNIMLRQMAIGIPVSYYITFDIRIFIVVKIVCKINLSLLHVSYNFV